MDSYKKCCNILSIIYIKWFFVILFFMMKKNWVRKRFKIKIIKFLLGRVCKLEIV